MTHPYIINSINAVILIVAGLIVYFLMPGRPTLVLVAPALGILLLACTYHLRKHNRFVMHTVTALTLLAGIVVIMRLNTQEKHLTIEYILLLLMGLSCLISATLFVGSFIRQRRLRNNTVYKDDL
jgi:peptidoglycan/LPS O-acetylase OafA/YrhL